MNQWTGGEDLSITAVQVLAIASTRFKKVQDDAVMRAPGEVLVPGNAKAQGGLY